jgi:hypothetical protein
LTFLGTKEFKDPLAAKGWKISTISALDQPCANCGSEKNIEMHHIKHIKTINVKLGSFDKLLARINRKQVSLCRPCHIAVHKGTHVGFSIRHFKSIKWEGNPK